MITHGAFGVRINGKDSIVYVHHDSCWEALGINIATDVVEYVSCEEAFVHFKNKAEELRPVNAIKEKHRKLFDLNSFSSFIENGEYYNASGFLFDSVRCEHAYIVNLDTETFEIYEGNQKTKPIKSRYAGKEDNGYWGVELVNEVPLKCLDEFIDLSRL